MKFLLLILVITSLRAYAQDSATCYYDASWEPTSKERSVYYVTFTSRGDVYDARSFFSRNNKKQGYGTFADTSMRKPSGLQVSYYKNGNVEDSVIYKAPNDAQEIFHYYENKQLGGHYYTDAKGKDVTEGFDESGSKIKNYIIAKEADFKGGEKAWNNYLLKHVNKDIVAKGKEKQIVTVQVLFCINESGMPSGVKVHKSSGVSMVDQDAANVIASAPSWNTAIHYNKPVKAYRIQPITYELEPIRKN